MDGSEIPSRTVRRARSSLVSAGGVAVLLLLFGAVVRAQPPDSPPLQVTITGSAFGDRAPDAGSSDRGTPDAGTPDPDAPVAKSPVAGSPDGGSKGGGNPARHGADLSVKVLVPDWGHAGDELVYLVVLHNNGPEPARSVVLTEILSPDVTVIASRTFPGDVECHLDGRIATCTAALVPAGSTFIGAMLVRANRACEIRNTARVSSESFDPVEENNRRSATTQVR